MMHDHRKSDTAVVPGKSRNAPMADAMEERAVAKGNSPERNVPRTQGRAGTPSALERVRQAAQRDRKQRFTALLHHVYDLARLRAAYFALKREAAAGVDGETWQSYGLSLETNLQDLAERLKRGTYRARSCPPSTTPTSSAFRTGFDRDVVRITRWMHSRSGS